MELALWILFFFVSLVQGNDNRYLVESEEKSNDQEAYESYNSPVIGAKSGNYAPKSGYPLPPTVPAGYSNYLSGLGYGYGLSPYSRYGVMPSPYLNYGSPYNALPYGYGAGLNSVLGTGLGLGNPVLGNQILGNPGYGGLGYRFGGLGYNAAYFRAPGVPAPLPSPYGAAPVPAGLTNGVLPLPASYAGAGVPVPGPAVAGRPPVITTQGKDGSLRYAYSPQRVPGY
ncbi:shematrin-like protein 1 [Parasteatoda tepidariorum]|uniref:shematrin-like protein 1 n=1 Tax=Parasteatoda tepidariorum TaxID=114398 RepID=UPI00077F999E|nr:uncharacterized protein LOC107449357 [Parasteatoda tepidariorum]